MSGIVDNDEPDGMLAYVLACQNPNRDDPNWPLPSFDAKDWAEAFHRRYPMVPLDMALAWFANALMRGYDEAHMQAHRRMRRA